MSGALYRICGNWIASFFTPLMGSGIASLVIESPISFLQALVIALVSSSIITGMAIGREIECLGKRK